MYVRIHAYYPRQTLSVMFKNILPFPQTDGQCRQAGARLSLPSGAGQESSLRAMER